MKLILDYHIMTEEEIVRSVTGEAESLKKEEEDDDDNSPPRIKMGKLKTTWI